jgi:phosphoribosylamine-glycine ligase
MKILVIGSGGREHALFWKLAQSPRGIEISLHALCDGLAEASLAPGTKIFHAGTVARGNEIVTSGGRVLGVTALGRTLAEARDRAYLAVEKIRFDGAQFRRDIGAKAFAKASN